MTVRGTIGLCCVHIAQLITHTVTYTLPFSSKGSYIKSVCVAKTG